MRSPRQDRFGKPKYRQLDQQCPLPDVEPLSAERRAALLLALAVRPTLARMHHQARAEL